MKYNILLLLLLTTLNLKADETIFKYGLGIFNSAKDSKAEMKQISVAKQYSLLKGYVIQQVEIGGWIDSRRDLGRKDSGFGSYSLGIPVDFDVLFLQPLWGIGLITSPDSMLGGRFPQFFHNFTVGIKDSKGNSIGVNYSHVSSAGLYKINKGRDVLSVRLGLPF